MDALSDILRMIRLRGSIYFQKDLYTPWGMQVDTGPYAQFHMIVRGFCWLQTAELADPLFLTAGDIVVFPYGQPHCIAENLQNRMIPGRQVVEAVLNQKPIFTGDVLSATLICGHFEFDRDFDHPFVKALPQMIHISNLNRSDIGLMEAATNVIIRETGSQSAGAEVVVDRLAEILFVQILRTYILRKSNETTFWAALQDEQISKSLKLIHTKPQENWTLESLAGLVGMSRSAFTVRFRELVGETPMRYITRWRMHRAKELLRIHRLPLIEIAEQVGYLSEAAFSRAFKRQFNQNPGAMRKVLAE